MASDQWKKNPNSLVGRTIVSPRLFIQNLVNWEVESNDLLLCETSERHQILRRKYL